MQPRRWKPILTIILVGVLVVAVVFLLWWGCKGGNFKPYREETPRFVEVKPQQPSGGSVSSTHHTFSQPTITYQYLPPPTNLNRCPACNGRGYFNDPVICPVCAGAGKVIAVRCVGYVGGIPLYERDKAPLVCPSCRGYGYFLPTTGRCETCGGRTLPEFFNHWRLQAQQVWLTTTGGRYQEINATP